MFVLLDLGVGMSVPAWRSHHGTDRDRSGPTTWYVDLVHVSTAGDSIAVRDLYADVLVPTDGRHQRLLDLDEFADAIEAGQLDVATAVDGLRRWQRFLDLHLHADRDPAGTWTDFPPRRLHDLAAPPPRPGRLSPHRADHHRQSNNGEERPMTAGGTGTPGMG
ncbi:DUF402 domain-containing protein [Saccharothrix longispora]|uniref:DUF402 domain-containing protein n=1 Tax=Saccharothrix longispora TaxID=33920 RepID=A0ABU1PSH2_9PSEU|nr:DUF402 domain-containing protein [Saccharothrix longispora]MDR6593584.1 hypothetical protein [Saccharothrix longispora]